MAVRMGLLRLVVALSLTGSVTRLGPAHGMHVWPR
jgi:hypothetical protein